MTTRVLTSDKGMTVTTNLTDLEALAILKTITVGNDAEFAAKLVKTSARYTLTISQMVWAHKLAIATLPPANRPASPVTTIGDMAGIIALFDSAKAHGLKKPKIRLSLTTRTGADLGLQLSVAGPAARYPGSIDITDGGSFGNSRHFGRIHRTDGRYEVGRAGTPDGMVAFLREFATHPAEVAAAYGKLRGSCCFCNRSLHGNDGRSIAVGYGPDCAEKWSQPWGVAKHTFDAPVYPASAPEDADGARDIEEEGWSLAADLLEEQHR